MLCDIWLCGGTVAWRWDLRGRSCTKHCVCRVSVRWWLVKGRVRHTAVVDIHGLSSMELLRQSAFTIPLSVGGFCSSWYVYTMELLWVASVRWWCILVISLFLFAIQLWHQWRIWIFAQSCAEVGECAGIDWNCVKHLKRSEKRYIYIYKLLPVFALIFQEFWLYTQRTLVWPWQFRANNDSQMP